MGLFGKKKSAETMGDATSVTLECGESVALVSTVDCIGDSCPRPQLMTKSALAKIDSGKAIGVLVDNPTSMEALPAIVTENGGEHVGTIRENRHWHVIARKL